MKLMEIGRKIKHHVYLLFESAFFGLSLVIIPMLKTN
jgi:hypothetical protein